MGWLLAFMDYNSQRCAVEGRQSCSLLGNGDAPGRGSDSGGGSQAKWSVHKVWEGYIVTLA